MLKFSKSIARTGAVVGLAALAAIATPAIGSAVVTGTATVTTNDNVVTVKVYRVGSPTLSACGVGVKNIGPNLVPGVDPGDTGGLVYLPENPGDGEYSTPRLPNGTYFVGVWCEDADGRTDIIAPLEEIVELDADPNFSSSRIGSLGSPGNVLDLLLTFGTGSVRSASADFGGVLAPPEAP
ncbi:hypothetical protein SAMN05444580_113124 [Rhodococcus tukisamuensis]|uniref:Secreted protein n=1 Tax=Rhodococcus tukisamuensis TaxID=168276 RepID=A0A1G7BNP5_9NOCA|nr:hypothetical protein SAMN05444580_113124 [Rhodococcus tukisamuensis]